MAFCALARDQLAQKQKYTLFVASASRAIELLLSMLLQMRATQPEQALTGLRPISAPKHAAVHAAADAGNTATDGFDWAERYVQLTHAAIIAAADAGNTASTGFDWAESYRAHRAIWQSQAIALGVEIPPEAW